MWTSFQDLFKPLDDAHNRIPRGDEHIRGRSLKSLADIFPWGARDAPEAQERLFSKCLKNGLRQIRQSHRVTGMHSQEGSAGKIPILFDEVKQTVGDIFHVMIF